MFTVQVTQSMAFVIGVQVDIVSNILKILKKANSIVSILKIIIPHVLKGVNICL